MLGISSTVRILICQKPIRMQKSFEGLSALVEELFPKELLSGALFVFFNKRRDLIKVLFWDRDGFVIWYKRLEKGSFAFNREDRSLSRREFLMLLEGITPQKMRSQFSV